MSDTVDTPEEMAAEVFKAGAMAMRVKIYTELRRRHDEDFLMEILDVPVPKWRERQ